MPPMDPFGLDIACLAQKDADIPWDVQQASSVRPDAQVMDRELPRINTAQPTTTPPERLSSCPTDSADHARAAMLSDKQSMSWSQQQSRSDQVPSSLLSKHAAPSPAQTNNMHDFWTNDKSEIRSAPYLSEPSHASSSSRRSNTINRPSNLFFVSSFSAEEENVSAEADTPESMSARCSPGHKEEDCIWRLRYQTLFEELALVCCLP